MVQNIIDSFVLRLSLFVRTMYERRIPAGIHPNTPVALVPNRLTVSRRGDLYSTTTTTEDGVTRVNEIMRVTNDARRPSNRRDHVIYYVGSM